DQSRLPTLSVRVDWAAECAALEHGSGPARVIVLRTSQAIRGCGRRIWNSRRRGIPLDSSVPGARSNRVGGPVWSFRPSVCSRTGILPACRLNDVLESQFGPLCLRLGQETPKRSGSIAQYLEHPATPWSWHASRVLRVRVISIFQPFPTRQSGYNGWAVRCAGG